MNLEHLKYQVDEAIERAKEHGDSPRAIKVWIQIDFDTGESIFTGDVEIVYDCDVQASGCVILGHGKADKQ